MFWGPVGSGVCPAQIDSQGSFAHWSPASYLNVDYLQYGIRGVDPSAFPAIFDFPSENTNPWPGAYGVYAGIYLPLNKYVSAAFTVANWLDMSSLYGQYSIGDLNYSAPISMSISYSCGDFGQFVPTTVVPNCLVNAATAGGSLSWQGAPNEQACVLQPGTTYYLNVINADISQLPSTGIAVSTANASCNANVCFDPLINGPGNWGIADEIFFGGFE